MKNSDLYTIIVTGCGERSSEYYAVSNLNNWKSIPYSKRENAVNQGELHAKILKTIYPQLNDPEGIKLRDAHTDQGEVK